MCLFVPDTVTSPSIAEDDIICYKVLEVRDRRASAPYMGTAYDIFGEKIDCGSDIHSEAPEWGSDDVLTVHEGFHTFATFDGAMDIAGKFGDVHGHVDGDGFFVFVAVIPKGTKYFKGVFEYTNVPNYVSESLIVYRRDSEFSQRYIRNLPDES